MGFDVPRRTTVIALFVNMVALLEIAGFQNARIITSECEAGIIALVHRYWEIINGDKD
jgi:hypothetical protein